MQLGSIVRDLSMADLSGVDRTERRVQKHQGQVTHLNLQIRRKGIGHDTKMKSSGKKFVTPGLREN